MKIDTNVRRLQRLSSGGQSQPRASNFESLTVAQVEGANAEAARSGRRFVGGLQILANAIAPVQAIPTTTASLALFNGDPIKNYEVDRIGFFLASGTPAAGASLMITVSPSKIATAPTTQATGFGVGSASGSSQRSNGLFATALAIPAVPAAAAWYTVLSNFQPATAGAVGLGDVWAELAGGIIVPPGFALGMAILSGAGTTPLYGVSLAWNEFDAELS